MSSTSRGYDRHVSDYYVTPIEKIDDFLKEFIKHEPDAFDGLIIDPCSGGDKDHLMSYPEALKQVGVDGLDINTFDIREDSLAEFKCDYLETKLPKKPRAIISNPPFLLAEQFIRKALNDVQNEGFVIMLLRLNFFGNKKRMKLWNEIGLPKYCFVHNRRMSFTDNGKTDSIEYAHFVFQKGKKIDFTQLQVI
ncbi:hypothetical protein [Paraliobacillus ryukyuensis]|uniref:hypothetical protein n=1 Tax=Paraliobacillus ryukyuensis TaxID=200904 RepID=UPI0009A55EDE|nr:hypothetical protein [Paraliobacillus ryukyuensis]